MKKYNRYLLMLVTRNAFGSTKTKEIGTLSASNETRAMDEAQEYVDSYPLKKGDFFQLYRYVGPLSKY